jgi:queuine tRNA-ribosyltransferase
MLGPMLLTWHNVHYYQDLTRGLRQAIRNGNFATYAAQLRAAWTTRETPE